MSSYDELSGDPANQGVLLTTVSSEMLTLAAVKPLLQSDNALKVVQLQPQGDWRQDG